jgi:hypothetical protein
MATTQHPQVLMLSTVATTLQLIGTELKIRLIFSNRATAVIREQYGGVAVSRLSLPKRHINLSSTFP